MKSRRLPAAIATALLLPLFAAGCGDSRQDVKPPRPVRVQVVAAAAAPPPLRFSGTVEPLRRVALAFETGGKIAALAQVPGEGGPPRTIGAGDKIRGGAVLARLDPLEAGQRALAGDAQLAEARALEAKAGQDLRRAETLFAQQAATLPELEAARAAAESAAQRVRAAAAQQAIARRGEGDTRLTAPFDATVLRRDAEIGALAAPGATLFELADTALLKVVFGVPDSVVGRLAPGQRLPLFTPVLAGAAALGRISTVSPSADPQSRVFAVEVEIPNPDDRLKIGMIVSVEVPNGDAGGDGQAAAAPRPAVPLSAVVRAQKSEGYAVFVLEGAGTALLARERTVAVGEIFGSEVALESGVRLGEKVIVAGATLLADGDPVVVIP